MINATISHPPRPAVSPDSAQRGAAPSSPFLQAHGCTGWLAGWLRFPLRHVAANYTSNFLAQRGWLRFFPTGRPKHLCRAQQYHRSLHTHTHTHTNSLAHPRGGCP